MMVVFGDATDVVSPEVDVPDIVVAFVGDCAI